LTGNPVKEAPFATVVPQNWTGDGGRISRLTVDKQVRRPTAVAALPDETERAPGGSLRDNPMRLVRG